MLFISSGKSTRDFSGFKGIAAAVAFSAGMAPVFGALALEQPKWKVEWAEKAGREMVKKLTAACPAASVDDQKAFEKCRAGVFKSKFFSQYFRDYILWGGGQPDGRVEEKRLTQFGQNLWRGLYLPLFMFSGKVKTEYRPDLNRMVVRAETRYRSKLDPGQYAYPFWHEPAKWGAYEKANELAFTIDMFKLKVIAIQRSPHGNTNAKWVVPVVGAPRKFKKDEWEWRDKSGKLQPQVTLFHGLYSDENPHLMKLDAAYRDFALQLRDQTCMVCHVPNNPEKMRHLVILQTPAHASDQIDRVIRAVKAGSMPVKSWAGPQSIKDPKAKAKFLASAEQFKSVVDTVKAWEAKNAPAK